jgi:ubiquinone/menaquinone biosynthesis C-methylase UbiE
MVMKRINYDDISAVYDRRYRSGCLSGIAEALWALAHRVKARCVLEAGCGTGYWLALMEGCDIRCGLDYSAGMLDKARQRDVSLELVRGTATVLPFREGGFDLVFYAHALHRFDDPPAFIKEAQRVLWAGYAVNRIIARRYMEG